MTNDLRRFSGNVEHQLAFPLHDQGDSPTVRVSLTVTAGLLDRVRETNPKVNLSEMLRRAMQEVLECQHRELRCSRCAATIDNRQVEAGVLYRFFADAMWALDDLVHAGGTAEGASRVIRGLAIGWGIPGAAEHPIAKASRRTVQKLAAQRAAEIEEEAQLLAAKRAARRESGDATGGAVIEAG